MNTRFKFRAWHEQDKYMLHETNRGDVFRWLVEGQPLVIEQFTGLYDKNCDPIFEGDILKNKTCKHVVYWNKETAAFNLKIPGMEFMADMRLSQEWIDKCESEIIGTIHD